MVKNSKFAKVFFVTEKLDEVLANYGSSIENDFYRIDGDNTYRTIEFTNGDKARFMVVYLDHLKVFCCTDFIETAA